MKSCLMITVLAPVIFLSCRKETSCEGGCADKNKPPIAVAGSDLVVTLPTDSILLDGSASNDPDGMISGWLWKKISGPASSNIVNTASSKTVIRNLDTGIYRFELKVTDDKNLSATDTVQITVNKQGQSSNRPPVANAGADQTITLPTNTINLDGSASTDPDNNITAYAWIKISGPSTFNIANGNAVQTQVINLVQGVYQFELKVTDAGGLFDKDTVQITVGSLSNPSVDVYVAGFESDDITINNIGVATYWKNGVTVNLTDGSKRAGANSIAVVGTDVYVAGWEYNGNAIRVAKYWKNGQAVTLSNGLRFAIATSVVVVGSDVYVAGWECDGSAYYSYNDWGDSSLHYHSKVKYWKNGVAVSLTDGTKNNTANSIAVVGSDVYVAGQESNGDSDTGDFDLGVAKYWKNEQEISLTDGTRAAYASSLAVVGSDVYVAGGESNNNSRGIFARYWKNGVAVSLTDGTWTAGATSIAVVGSDVYVAGFEENSTGVHYNISKYWKNGVAVNLTYGSQPAGANSIAIVGGDVYVAGVEYNGTTFVAKYWKNGQAINLTDSSKWADAKSIVVIQH